MIYSFFVNFQLVNGYFVHYFAVDSAFTMPKDVLFVLDTSGSMSGRKIVQLRDAMLNIIEDVHSKDKFNIMAFSSDIRYWKSNELVDATTKNINEAKIYTRNLQANGGMFLQKQFFIVAVTKRPPSSVKFTLV